ncbi:M23 family metallopeptidase [Mucilaginibacter gynuensis]|uniref:M23 family metallopeptidase n=1 Tax=Mucilaginibacter gynuensis TaxID=1302236 RepID=A0ABP8HB64_9SPHI
MIKKTLTALIYCLCLYTASAQDVIQSKFYPKDFRYPLDLPPSTAGSFGELRPNHFHSGLDFKTNQRIGYPVYAVFDGYISRLRIQYGGFGRAVYITHPNGYTTVYGHLDSFSPNIEKIVRDYQIQTQSYEVDFAPMQLQLPIFKGQQFAVSGNAGASAGPHLHFEIRDTETQETINPQLFGLTIPDNVPPSISAIATYHLNGAPFSEKTPHMFLAVTGAGGNYRLTNNQPVHLSGEVGFGLTAYDRNSASVNRNGIYSVELKLDGTTVYTFTVERFAFDQTRAINAYVDYPSLLSAGRWMQKCFVPPGSNVSLYPQAVNRGIIDFNDDAMHDVEYVVRDVAGNTSTLAIKVKSTPHDPFPAFKPTGQLFRYDQQNEFNAPNVKVIVPKGNLYDNLDFQYTKLPKKPGTFSDTHRIHNKFTQLHEAFNLWIKPDTSIGKNADKAVIMNAAGNVAAGTYEDGYVKAQCRYFGDYFVKIDTIAPVISPVNIRNRSNLAAVKSITLRISDNLSGVKSFAGKIDGKWVLVEHDFKSKLYKYYFDNDIKPGKHTFELTSSDNTNNVSQFTADFYR